MLATEVYEIGTGYEEEVIAGSSTGLDLETPVFAENVRLALKEKKRITASADTVLVKGTLVVSF